MMKHAGDAAEPDTDAVVVIRNMNSRTQSRHCTCVHCIFGRNTLRTQHNLAGDLASHMFGHLVSTEVARDILTTFVVDGVVQVFEGVIPHNEQPPEAPLDPRSEDVQCALGQAFKAATAHDCIRLHPGDNVPVKHSPPADQEKKYTFRWRIFPGDSFQPGELVFFLNEVTDRAFAAAKAYFATRKLGFRHRLAALGDEHQFVSLTYDPDQDIPPPGFLLLPIEAFLGEDFGIVDTKYVSYSAARLVGELKEHLEDGFDRMQWYSEGLKCAQPWVYYVLGLTFSPTLDVAFFSRVDMSDWEHLALLLWDGRGCIELIRILLGLALADGVDLGQNPDIELMRVARTFELEDRCHPSYEVPSTTDSDLDDDDATSVASSSDSSVCKCQNSVEKRSHSEIEMEDDSEEDPQLKKHKIVEDI